MPNDAAPSPILFVDDDPDLRMLCQTILEGADYLVQTAADGMEALKALEQTTYALLILDWKLPKLGGQPLLETIAWRWPDLPIIVVTGYSDEDKAVAAVEYAQAYLRKPFDKQALLNAVGRVIHRAGTWRSGEYAAATRPLPAADDPSKEAELDPTALRVNPLRCEARIGASPAVPLTATEYAVLNHLFLHAGDVVPHQAIARVLSDRPLSAKESAALCKHHIRALRTKLEPDPARPVYIKTVWGRGYRLVPAGE